jgi:hypothetical protein
MSLAAFIDLNTTLEQVDEISLELRSLPRDENVVKLFDDLLLTTGRFSWQD